METLQMVDKTEVVKWESDGTAVMTEARALTSALKDSASLNRCAEFLLNIKRRLNAVKEGITPVKQKSYAAYKEVLALETRLTEPFERAEREIIKPAMGRFHAEQERARRETEDKMRAEAKKREEEARLEEAQRLTDSGDKDMADAVLDAPMNIAPVVLPEPEKVEGISYKDVWKYRITNEALIPNDYRVIDEKKIGAVVRALKAETKIPGVEVYSEKTVAGRV